MAEEIEMQFLSSSDYFLTTEDISVEAVRLPRHWKATKNTNKNIEK